MVRVGLLWHSLSSGNLGVRALTLAQLELLEQAGHAAGRDLEVRIFGHPPWEGLPASDFVGRRVAVAAPSDLGLSAMLRRPRQLVREMRACSVLIDIGEGDSFTDVYGNRRFAAQLVSKLLALRSGRPLILAPQTIGPFASGPSRRAAAYVLRRAAAVFGRDSVSCRDAAELSGRADIIESTDLAFTLSYRARPRHAGAVRVGLNPSGLLWSAAGARFGLASSYPELIERLIEVLARQPGTEVVLVPHVSSRDDASDQDAALCNALARRHPGVIAQPPFMDPRDAKAFIAGLDFFVGTRLHACIAAHSSGVPLLALAYTRKTTDLFASLDYPAVADMTMESVGDIEARLVSALSSRETLRSAVQSGNARALTRLMPYTEMLKRLVAREE